MSDLKLATMDDLPEVFNLVSKAHEELLYKLPLSQERTLNVLKHVLDNGVIICLTAPQIVGVFIALKTLTATSLEPIAAELLWYVLPQYRGRSSLKLLEAYEYWAKEIAGVSVITIGNMLNESSTGTHKLYLRKGYELSEQTYFKKLEPKGSERIS